MPDTTSLSLPGNGPPGRLKVYPDLILGPGSLVLVDHNLSNLASVPGNAALVPNIAWKSAAAILGAGDATSLSAYVSNSSPVGIVQEVTLKKGLHGIVNQSTQTGFCSIRVPDAVRAYILTNIGHRFFVSLWGYDTRVALIAGTPFLDAIRTSAPTGNYIFNMNQGATNAGGTGNSFRNAVNQTGNIQNVGYFIRNLTHGGVVGTISDPLTLIYEVAHWGARNADASTPAKGPSVIHYRTYIEDLTVSGRSYATVDALDLALFTAATTSGGRLFGDTFTPP